MKRAYVDLSIEGLNDLLHLYPGRKPMDYLVQSVEISPVVEGGVRLHLAGDALPETYSDEPRQTKLWYDTVYDETFPYRGIRATIYDPDNNGETDTYQHHYHGGEQTDSFSVIKDGLPPRKG